MEQAPAHHQVLRRLLDVQDTAACRHPLSVTVGDQPAATVGVLVPEGAVDYVRHGLETAVRVPRRSLGLARRVVDLTHLVHVNEGVEHAKVDSSERPANRETLALVGRRRRRDGEHLTIRRDGPIGF